MMVLVSRLGNIRLVFRLFKSQPRMRFELSENLPEISLSQPQSHHRSAEEIRCVFDDNSKIILLISSLKTYVGGVFIRIASARRF